MDEKARRHRPEHSDDLVVATRHLDLVLDQLAALRERGAITNSPADFPSNELLGLSLVPLEFPPDPVAAEDLGARSASAVGVDEVLRMVRQMCEYRYRGWTPTIGKNRVVSGIGGEGGMLVGGGGMLVGGGGGLPEVPDEAPKKARGSRGANAHVALLDTPIYRDTPALDRVDYEGRPPHAPATQPVDAGHAAFALGLIERAAPGAHVHVRPTLDEYAAATAWHVAEAMAKLAGSAHHVDIVNLSLGCYTLDNQPPLLLQRAVAVLAPTTLIVAAAGNHREPKNPRPFWPAALDDVVAVGAVDDRGHLATFSPRAPWVEVTAPGVGVVSDYLDGKVKVKSATDRTPAQTEQFPGYARWRGTSFAAATVTGEIAAHMTARRDARTSLRYLLDLPNGKSPVHPYRYQ